MRIINLYRYEEIDGSITITPDKRNVGDTIHALRVIADEGKILLQGDDKFLCRDIQENELVTINEIPIQQWEEQEIVEEIGTENL